MLVPVAVVVTVRGNVALPPWAYCTVQTTSFKVRYSTNLAVQLKFCKNYITVWGCLCVLVLFLLKNIKLVSYFLQVKSRSCCVPHTVCSTAWRTEIWQSWTSVPSTPADISSSTVQRRWLLYTPILGGANPHHFHVNPDPDFHIDVI